MMHGQLGTHGTTLVSAFPEARHPRLLMRFAQRRDEDLEVIWLDYDSFIYADNLRL